MLRSAVQSCPAAPAFRIGLFAPCLSGFGFPDIGLCDAGLASQKRYDATRDYAAAQDRRHPFGVFVNGVGGHSETGHALDDGEELSNVRFSDHKPSLAALQLTTVRRLGLELVDDEFGGARHAVFKRL
jgi:hypothetical protein